MCFAGYTCLCTEKSENLKNMLCNPHLRTLLLEVDSSDQPGHAIRKAMEVPIFSEFAEVCLRTCGLRNDDEEEL